MKKWIAICRDVSGLPMWLTIKEQFVIEFRAVESKVNLGEELDVRHLD